MSRLKLAFWLRARQIVMSARIISLNDTDWKTKELSAWRRAQFKPDRHDWR